MRDRYEHIRDQLDRARQHVARCRQAVEQFDSDGGPDRARQKLLDDLHEAQISAGWCEIALADATSPMEVPQSQATDRCRLTG